MPRRFLPAITLPALSASVVWGLIEFVALCRCRLTQRRAG
jgi:hypothetical protein